MNNEVDNLEWCTHFTMLDIFFEPPNIAGRKPKGFD